MEAFREAATGVSVVIPTYAGHADAVPGLLKTLQVARDATDVPTEVIVVDDSDPHASASIRRVCEQFAARYLNGPREVGKKLNLGVRYATHPILLFVSSDTEATRDLLKMHAAAYECVGSEVGGILGLTRYVGERAWVWKAADLYGWNPCFGWAEQYDEVLWGPTNLSMRRSIFERVGGFADEGWTVFAGEDVDLGVRVTEAGWVIRTEPQAELLHPRSAVSFGKLITYLFRAGRADAWLCTRFPRRRVFAWDPGLMIAAVAGIAAFGGGMSNVSRAASALVGATTAVIAVVGWRARYQWSKLERKHLRGTPFENFCLSTAAAVLSLAFDVGAVSESLRRGRFDNVGRRFDYVPAAAFRRRSGGEFGGRR